MAWRAAPQKGLSLVRLLRELAGLFRSVRYDLRHSRRARLTGILAVLGMAIGAGIFDPADTTDQPGNGDYSTGNSGMMDADSDSPSSSSSKSPSHSKSDDHDEPSSHDKPTTPRPTKTPTQSPTPSDSPSDTPTTETSSAG